jgi:hypothetical protein
VGREQFARGHSAAYVSYFDVAAPKKPAVRRRKSVVLFQNPPL